jgi:hypothetical protein
METWPESTPRAGPRRGNVQAARAGPFPKAHASRYLRAELLNIDDAPDHLGSTDHGELVLTGVDQCGGGPG